MDETFLKVIEIKCSNSHQSQWVNAACAFPSPCFITSKIGLIMADWISEEKESELIEMWQARRVLYDVTAKGYSNRIQRLTVLSEIAEVFGTTRK